MAYAPSRIAAADPYAQVYVIPVIEHSVHGCPRDARSPDARGILHDMADSDTGDLDVQQAPEERFHRNAAERIREHSFPLAVRGYERQAVDDFVEQVADLVAELEGRQTRETVVQRALDQVGEETAGILQRAHQAADELAARSRSQAEGRIQRADREAELLRRQADEYAEKVIVDTQLLWDERQRLLDDLRQLADEVLATADEAAERVTLPEQLGPPEEESTVLTDQPTTEVELDVLPGGAGLEEPGEPLSDEPLPPPALYQQPLEEPAAPADDDTVEHEAIEEPAEEPAEAPDEAPGGEQRPRAGNDE
jgi:DivIVA domain-containing protein